MPALETQSDALAHIYARSLFDLAEEAGGQKRIEETAAELEAIIEITRENPSFIEFLRSAILPAEKRGQSLKRIFSGRVSDLTLNFLLVLNHKGRLAHIAAIASAFDELAQEKFGRVEVDVYTAAPIERSQLKAIGDRLRAAIKREPVLHAYTDESMIGGLKLQIGDQMIDASVATQLRKVRERLVTHGAAELRARADRMLG